MATLTCPTCRQRVQIIYVGKEHIQIARHLANGSFCLTVQVNR